MKNLFCAAAVLFVTSVSCLADMSVGPWTPIFRGIDHAVGSNTPSTTVTNNDVVFVDSRLQSVHCVRVDLTDPTVQLFTTPPAPSPVLESRETLSLSISNFIRNYGVQVASDANFYSANPGGSDPTSEGVPCEVYGLLISTGQVVSVSDNSGSGRYASLLFTTNNAPIFDFYNRPPGTNTTGIYTAITGYYPLLTNGLNVWALYNSDFTSQYPDSSIHGAQPRTAFGISQDKRYLYMMTIDGRQSGYSDGAIDQETAMWLLQFGAWDGINMDGGGSTAMYMADCSGNPIALNHSSLLASTQKPHERLIGDHFGVYAQPLSTIITSVAAAPGSGTALITWTTLTNATSQVEYGLTQSYGTLSTNDPTMVTSHALTLSGLNSGTRYYYRVISSDGTTQYTNACGISFTTAAGVVSMVFGLTNDWKYSTADLDGINWQAPGYDDSGWPHGPGVLWTDTRYPGVGNTAIQFLGLHTEMPIDPGTTWPFITYYFRTHFTYTNTLSGVTLTFSNYIDDGAVFSLNGVEIGRTFVPASAVNSTLASGYNCSGDATCPYVFTIPGTFANLQAGDNVLAVEVHNYSAHSPDITFGQALFSTVPSTSTNPPPPFITNVVVTPGETSATITWLTLSNSSSQIRYGTNASLALSTPLDATLVTNHFMTLTGLVQLTNYYFRIVSIAGTSTNTFDGVFSTVPFYVSLVPLNNIWAFQTNNLDGVNWMAPGYDETLFYGDGSGLLYLQTNTMVGPLNTPLPSSFAGLPYPTYYFRTHFFFNTNLVGLALKFTNYIDAGAIFYLNGVEVQRVRMPAAPQTIVYSNLATACAPVNCQAASNAPDIFRLSNDSMTNLVLGADNVLAVEVHPSSQSNSNVVFGSSLGLVRILASESKLHIARSGALVTLTWNGVGLTLQSAHLLASTNSFTDVSGGTIKKSPYSILGPTPPIFYRLRD